PGWSDPGDANGRMSEWANGRMSECDRVLIIGGGVVGLCSAYYLSQSGREIVLLDQGDIGAGASFGNAGLLVVSHCKPLAAPGVLKSGLQWLLDAESPFYIKPRADFSLVNWLWRFRGFCNRAHVLRSIPVLRKLHVASFRLYQELSELPGMDFGLEHRGLLMPCLTSAALNDEIREAEMLSEHGIEYRVLGREDAHSMMPQLTPTVMGGIYFLADGHLDPAKFLEAMAGCVRARGVTVMTKTEVIGFRTASSRVETVETTRGDYAVGEVVLATGAWSGYLSRQLELSLPIQPAKGYSITVRRLNTAPSIPILSNETKVAVTPMGGLLRCSGTLEMAGLDLSINRRRVDAVLNGARKLIDGLDEPELVEIWRGLRPCTPDGLPVVGRAPGYENLVVAAGHATIGQSLGPVTGKLVSEIVLGDTPSQDIAPLHCARFS
ncbi:MAG: FAD-dependent oxidoreductase, partial [Armatimonadetes bacterium CG_4_8_14_3_um_filter_58_9]